MFITLETLVAIVRTKLPPWITVEYLDGFVDRHRDTLLEVLREALDDQAPLTVKERTDANLAAMELAAHPPRQLRVADRRTLRRYTGWGGLSIRKVADRFPDDFPTPDPAGLVHEYYTP